MKHYWDSLNTTYFKKIIKRILFFFIGVLALLFIISNAFAVYFYYNKEQIVNQINQAISEKINGTIHIGDIQYESLKGFPNVTLNLKQVELKDSLWAIHKRTLLKADNIGIRLNLMHLLANEIVLDKIEIDGATFNFFIAKNGYDNTRIFKSRSKEASEKESIDISFDEIILNQVHFISENVQNNKLFDFDNISLKSKIDYQRKDWQTTLYLETSAKSMAFNTVNGSFIRDKTVKGTFDINYLNEKNSISVETKNLIIGKDLFDVKGHFSLDKDKSPFEITIKTKILWREASRLLTNKISSKLDQFDLKKPINASCKIKGDMSAEGDPEIIVNTIVRNNELHVPDAVISDCSFEASFTNNSKNGMGFNDKNSIIVIQNGSGIYKSIPFKIPRGAIDNFENTIASGSLTSDFDMIHLNEIISKDFMHFSKGHAKVNLDFKANIVNLEFQKPHFTGNVSINNTTVKYGPRNLTFQNTDVQLDFTERALLIKKLQFKDRLNEVFMEGKINNFLNLYYDNPEKMVVNWSIYCPYFDVKQFVGLVANSSEKEVKKPNKTDNFSNKLNSVVDKSQVVLNLKSDKMVYGKLLATNAKMTVLLMNNKLIVKKGWVQSAGGIISFDGQIGPQKKAYLFESKVQVNQVGIERFLSSFDNFGIQSFAPKNIKGKLTASASVKGTMLSGGKLDLNSLVGKSQFDVYKGALIDFQPIRKIGKFVFPFRNTDSIVFSELSADLKLKGDRVHIKDLKVSSNVLNLDVNGIYSFNEGTNLSMIVPLRNPKKDEKIKDSIKKEDKRYKGIILYLLAVDEEGKIKIKWDKNHDERP